MSSKKDIANLAAALETTRAATKAAYAALVAAGTGPEAHPAYVAWMQADEDMKAASKAHRDATRAPAAAPKAEVDCNTGRIHIRR